MRAIDQHRWRRRTRPVLVRELALALGKEPGMEPEPKPGLEPELEPKPGLVPGLVPVPVPWKVQLLWRCLDPNRGWP